MEKPRLKYRCRVKITKHNNTPKICKLGHNHKSTGEAGHCDRAELRRIGGEFKSFKVEVRYDLEVRGVKVCTHAPDFTMFPTDNPLNFWVEEWKGHETAMWRLKKKMFNAMYPKVEYLVFYQSKVRKK